MVGDGYLHHLVGGPSVCEASGKCRGISHWLDSGHPACSFFYFSVSHCWLLTCIKVMKSPENEKNTACGSPEIGCWSWISSDFWSMWSWKLIWPAGHYLLLTVWFHIAVIKLCLIVDDIWKLVSHGHNGLFCYQHNGLRPEMVLMWSWFFGVTGPEKSCLFVLTFERERWWSISCNEQMWFPDLFCIVIFSSVGFDV